MLTGESIPSELGPGDSLLSGSIVMNGVLTIQTESTMRDSTVSKILELVENASHKKTNTERFITKFASIYTPIVVVIAILLCLIPTIFFHFPFSDWFYRSLVFLVVSCPCALVISIPLGFFCGLGAASRNGILVKGSHSLETLAKMDVLVLDKTGTMTEGKFRVVEICPKSPFKKEEILEYAAYAECYSNHPIGRSFVEMYDKKVYKSRIKNQEEFAGYGIWMEYQNKKVLVGNEKLFHQHQIPVPKVNSIGTIIYIAINSVYAGYFIVADALKEDTISAISSLRQVGIHRFIVLSGDNESIVADVCNRVGISEYYANLLPQNKVKKVEQLLCKNQSYHKIGFVGDGINDAPVLMLSDLGISMGGIGSDAAIEASDVVIMDDRLSRIAQAKKIAKRTQRIVWQNIFLAILVKLIVLFLGAFGVTSIWAAVFADVGVTILAILNSLRILTFSNKLVK